MNMRIHDNSKSSNARNLAYFVVFALRLSVSRSFFSVPAVLQTAVLIRKSNCSLRLSLILLYK